MTDEEFMQLVQASQKPEQGMRPGADAPQPGQDIAAAQEYLKDVDIGTAAGAGAIEGLSLGAREEILSLIDQLTGEADKPGYLSPEQRTELMRRTPSGAAAYDVADIIGSLATSAIPGGKVAQTAMGAVEGAMRAKEGEALTGGLIGAASGLAGGALGKKVSGVLGKGKAKRLEDATKKQQEAGKTLAAAERKIAEIESKLLSLPAKERVQASKLADKLDDDILKQKQEVEKLKSQGVVEGLSELEKRLAQAEKQLSGTTPRVAAAEKGVFDTEEKLTRLFAQEQAAGQELAAGGRQMGMFEPDISGRLPDIARQRAEEMAVLAKRQKELGKRQTEQQFSQKAVDELRMAVEQAKKQPRTPSPELATAEERLAALTARRARPMLTEAGEEIKQLQAALPQLDLERTMARQIFEKPLEQLSKEETSLLKRLLQDYSEGVGEVAGATARTTGARLPGLVDKLKE